MVRPARGRVRVTQSNVCHLMKFEHLSAGASPGRNDDHIAVFESPSHADIIVIDGGTSVAGCDYIDEAQGDVAWFVHAFTAALAPLIQRGASQHDCVQQAIATVRVSFNELGAGSEVPAYAWPIAALTWIRIASGDSAAQATLYSLGDCITLLRTASGHCIDLDPFINPQDAVLQDAIAALHAEGILDPVQRRERMLPMLRARRTFQNTAPAPTVLCLFPNGPFQPRMHRFALEPNARLLVMTDGFYRLVDPYELYTDDGLVGACIERGLRAQLDELRNFEASGTASGVREVKAADDASAVLVTVPA